MANKPNRSRRNRVVTIDEGTAKSALAEAKRLKPPITALSRLIDLALAEWTEQAKRRRLSQSAGT